MEQRPTTPEFTPQAERILRAFGLAAEAALQIGVTEDGVGENSEIWCDISIQSADMNLDVWFCESPSSWGFCLSPLGHGYKELRCLGWPDEPEVEWLGEMKNSPWLLQQAHIMARALCRLGFDSSPVETEFDLTLSPEEKGRWARELD